MRTLRFWSGAALAAGVGLMADRPAIAADPIADMARAPAAPMGSSSGEASLRDREIALRAQWLARGHSVQELAATAPPAITGGSVTASTITVGKAGEFPSLSLSYTTGTPGLSFVSVEFAAINGKTGYGGGYGIYEYTQGGTINFAITTPLSLYASPGPWTIVGATIVDNAGNATTYHARQLQKLLSGLSFNVINNGPVVTTPPYIVRGRLLNTTVSLSAPLPTLAATITANDQNGPGIYIAFLRIQPQGQSYSEYSYLPNPRPVPKGKINANNIFGPSSPTGTWNILGYGVCDYANNCSGSSNDAEVVELLGTDTFTVTP